MKKGLKAIAAIIAVTGLGTLAACKHGHQGCDPGKLKEHIESKLKSLGATEEQKRKIGPIADRIIADGDDLHKKNKGLCRKMIGCLLLDTPNAEWLHRTVDQQGMELTAFAHRAVDSLIEISGNLTPEQRAQLKKRVATEE